VYEVLWLRRFSELFGASAFAVSATLAGYMAGLGIGALLGARWSASAHSPLRLYARLELLLVPAALSVDLLLAAAAPLFTRAYEAQLGSGGLNALRAAVALLVLMLPTILMGATLPALAQAVVRSRALLARPLGLLYGLNTLGAALGVSLAGFLLFEAIGLTATRNLAFAANAAVGLIAWLAAGRFPAEAQRTVSASPSPHEGGHSRRAVVAAYTVCGASALVLEVVWTRTLILYTGSTTYAFTTMLVLVLVGIGLGSLLAARFADVYARLHSLLATVIVVTAVMSVAGFLLLPSVASRLEAWIVPEPSFARLLAVVFTIASVAILIPAVGFGAVFPIVARHQVKEGVAAGFATGRAYAANLLGSVMGAYLGGFVMIPLLGLYDTLRLVAGVMVATAFVLWQNEPLHATRSVRAGGAAVCGVIVAALLLLPGAAPLHSTAAGESLVYYAEGASATVSVVRDQSGAKTLFIDRMSVAGTDPIMQTDQKSLAHIPMLLHPEPRRVLTVGFGSGGASWSYTRYPMLERVDCVEIAPEVVNAAPHLREANHDLFAQPGYRVVFDDARSYLRHTNIGYDIIATDCTDLRYKGNASLYTKEYFALCRRRLRPRGLVVVWMPLGGLSDDLFKMALRTFSEALPHVSVWYMNNYPTHYVLLIGSETPHALNWDTLLQRMDIPDVRQDLATIQLDNPFRLASTFLLDTSAYRRFVAGAAINSDERPLLEFRAPRVAGLFTGAENLRHLLAEAARGTTLPLQVTYGESQRRTVMARVEPYLQAAALVNQGHVSYQTGWRDFSAAIAHYRAAAAANPADEYLPELIRATERTRDLTREAYRASAEAPGAAPGALHNYGLSLLESNEPAEALVVFQRLVALRPDVPAAQLDLARAARQAGRTPEALAAADRAVSLAPAYAPAHFERGQARLDAGDREGALASFREATVLDPTLAEAHFNAGNTLVALNRLDEARAAYIAGLEQNPEQMAARVNYAQVLLLLGHTNRARAELQRVMSAPGPARDKARALLASLEGEANNAVR
jgi:spermidine synthase